jgi:hypothetical protein
MIKKLLLVLGASTALVIAGGLAPAQAADGDQLIVNGDFSAPTANGLLNVPGATTDFSLTTLFGQANNGPTG